MGFHEILAANAATRAIIESINHDKRVHFSDFIILNRQYGACLYAFFGKNQDKTLVDIPEITGPESLITERQILTNHLPSDWKIKVFSFSHAGQKYIKQFTSNSDKGRTSYRLEKNDFFLRSKNDIPFPLAQVLSDEHPLLDRNLALQNSMMHNYPDNSHIDFTKLAKRLSLTCNFGTVCDKLSRDMSEYAPILQGFKSNKVLPLVGTLRKHFAGYTVAHFLCSVDMPDTKKENKLKNLIPKLDHHIPYLLYENTQLHSCIADCADLDFENTDDVCRTYKLLVRHKEENKIYILYVVVFSKEIIRSKHRDLLIIYQYKNYFKKNGFDVCMDTKTISEIKKI